MNSEKLYSELNKIADKLNITVMEKSFRNTEIPVKSGLCKVKGEWRFIMDKKNSIGRKNKILAKCLAEFSVHNLEINPGVKKFILKNSGS